MTVKKFSNLAAYLREETGLAMALVVPRSHAELERAVRREEIDFALQDPHTYRQVSKDFDGSALLQTVALNGTTEQSGVLVVRRESGVLLVCTNELSSITTRAPGSSRVCSSASHPGNRLSGTWLHQQPAKAPLKRASPSSAIE